MIRRMLGALLAAASAAAPASAQPVVPGQAVPQAQAMPPGQPAPLAIRPTAVSIEAGTGRLVELPASVATIMAADPRIARAQPASPTSLFLIGVAAGETTVVATREDGTPVAQFDVSVRPGRGGEGAGGRQGPASPGNAALAQSAIRQIVQGAGGVQVRAAGGSLVLSGTVPTPADSQRAEAIARGIAGERGAVVNELEVMSSVQVNLRVRVMEVSRDVTRDLGFNWQALARSGDFLLGLRSGSAAGAVRDVITGAVAPGTTSAPSRLGVGFNTGRYDINAIIDALAEDRLLTILAEPNLTAQSGETASFLAGGEFPVPVSAQITGQITIQFKQFGVSLSFVPTVLGPDRLNLRVRPEVSELSDNGAITVPLAGGTVRIPAVSVRRAETTVEVGSGQSFAIAGLLQRTSSQAASGVAGMGELPVIGALFRSDRFRRAETELVIIVTPYLVRPVNERRALTGPTDGFRPATDLDRILLNRQVARGAQPVALPQVNAGFILE